MVCTPNNPTGPAITQAGAGRVPGAGAVARAGRVDEAYRRVRAHGRPGRRAGDCACARQRGRRRARSPRPTGWPASGSGTPSRPARSPPPCVRCSLPFGVSRVAQAAAVASLARRAELLERVDALVARARPGVVDGLRGGGGTSPRRRATSCGSRSATAPPSSPRPPTSRHRGPARSPARAPGSASASRRPTTVRDRGRRAAFTELTDSRVRQRPVPLCRSRASAAGRRAAIVVRKYAVPIASSAGRQSDRGRPAMPPSRPPNGHQRPAQRDVQRGHPADQRLGDPLEQHGAQDRVEEAAAAARRRSRPRAPPTAARPRASSDEPRQPGDEEATR